MNLHTGIEKNPKPPGGSRPGTPVSEASSREDLLAAITQKDEEISYLQGEISAVRESLAVAQEQNLDFRMTILDLQKKLEASSNEQDVGLKEIATLLRETRNLFHTIAKDQNQEALALLLEQLNELVTDSQKLNIPTVHQVVHAVESLVKFLKNTPDQINPAILRTATDAIDLLISILEEKKHTQLKAPSTCKILAVDDDENVLKTLQAALERVEIPFITAQSSMDALNLLEKENFDLLILDIGLPDMSGLDLSVKIREFPQHKKTPIMFLTGMNTFQNRAQSSLSGGNDFVGKPFKVFEFSVKSLTWVLRGHLGMI